MLEDLLPKRFTTLHDKCLQTNQSRRINPTSQRLHPIEVRGHTLRHPISASKQYRDNWDLAYARSRAVMQYLQDVVKIKPSRFRVSVAEANEPIHVGTDRAKLRQNSRVEVYMLNEVVADLTGTDVEKGKRFVNPDTR
ncbi:MAG TPA: OmpA family protein [Pirellulaceae bacterium]|nr:OmpA family protein [Pirellulaceae bacterium]